MGACQWRELYAMKIGDFRDLSTSFLVVIPTRKVKLKREFTVTGKYYDFIKKYIDLRPVHKHLDTFFLNYQKGKCTVQRIGINKFSAMKKQIALFLNKPDPEKYSGHSFVKTFITKQTETMSDDEDCAEDSGEDFPQNSEIKSEKEDCLEELDETVTSILSGQSNLQVMSEEEDFPEYCTPQEIDDASTTFSLSEETQIKLEHCDEASNSSIHSTQYFQNNESSSLVPKKSAKKYREVYNMFMEWRSKNGHSSFSEDVLLQYFEEQSKKYRSSSLWTHYSMLRGTIDQNHKVKINNYLKLKAFLKRKSIGYQAKKTNTFSARDIDTFVKTAQDYKYLATKVALIMGIMGACRCQELYAMKIEDVQDLKTSILVTIPTRKVKVHREFTITGRFYYIVKKYIDLRPAQIRIDSFFLNYYKGKCTPQKVGINKFSTMGKQIASYLNKPNPETYSGLTFCKSSATIQSIFNEEYPVEIDPQNFQIKLEDYTNEASTSQRQECPEYYTLSDIDETSTSSNLSMLPKKSAKIYQEVYKTFSDWKQKKGDPSFSEDLLLEYFEAQSKRYSPSSLWTHYSMLRSTIDLHHGIKINEYSRVKAFLKARSFGYQAKKPCVFSPEDVNTFLENAPDYKYLATKVMF